MIYDKKYVLGLHPHFWQRAAKTLEISCDERNKVIFYVNEVAFGPAPNDGGLLPVKPTCG